MKYLGNFYKKMIDPNWIDIIDKNSGQARPGTWNPINDIERAEFDKAKKAGIDFSKTLWYVYESQDVDFDIKLPWSHREIHWWITKMLPGQYMPMHTDPHTHDRKCKRYWIPLQDYVPGHVFIYDEQLIQHYAKGDVFEYYDANDSHGAANLSTINRYVLQVTEYVL